MKKKDIGSMPGFQADRLIKEIGSGKDVVEIGSYRGRTARRIALEGNKVICIEPFIGGYSKDRASQELLTDNDVKSDFIKNTADLNVVLIEKFSYDAIKDFNEEIDVLIIDGNHDYEAVKKDCRWINFVKSGGVFFFHDYGSRHEGVKRAVDEMIILRGYEIYKKFCTLIGFKK